MPMRFINPPLPIYNANVSGTSPVKSTPFDLRGMFSASVSYLVSIGSGLTATFQILVSMDGVNYYDSGQTLPNVSGSAKTFIAEFSTGFPYVIFQTTPSSGTGTVSVSGFAKGGA